ncbi:MAG: hypothetical protein AB1578_14325 [Thermodesulfobacteriota bacterium]
MNRVLMFLVVALIASPGSSQELVSVQEVPPDGTWGRKFVYEWKVGKETNSLVVVFKDRKQAGWPADWLIEIGMENCLDLFDCAKAGTGVSGTTADVVAAILDKSWTMFDEVVKDAVVGAVKVDLAICSDMWGEVEGELRRGMAKLKGREEYNSDESAQFTRLFGRLVSESKSMSRFRDVASRRGKTFGYVGYGDMLLIQEALWRLPWREIAKEPWLGMKHPIWVWILLNPAAGLK